MFASVGGCVLNEARLFTSGAFGQLFAAQRLGDRAHGLYIDQTCQPAEVQNALGRLCGVGGRSRVGHGEYRGESADGRGSRTAGNGLGILTTRLAQVGVQVDQARQRDQTVRVDGLVDGARGGVQRSDRRDHAVADQHVLTAGAEQVGSLDQDVHVRDPSPANRW